jgi:hypothetical protein
MAGLGKYGGAWPGLGGPAHARPRLIVIVA